MVGKKLKSEQPRSASTKRQTIQKKLIVLIDLVPVEAKQSAAKNQSKLTKQSGDQFNQLIQIKGTHRSIDWIWMVIPPGIWVIMFNKKWFPINSYGSLA